MNHCVCPLDVQCPSYKNLVGYKQCSHINTTSKILQIIKSFCFNFNHDVVCKLNEQNFCFLIISFYSMKNRTLKLSTSIHQFVQFSQCNFTFNSDSFFYIFFGKNTLQIAENKTILFRSLIFYFSSRAFPIDI